MAKKLLKPLAIVVGIVVEIFRTLGVGASAVVSQITGEKIQ
jgi:hypothetical protein